LLRTGLTHQFRNLDDGLTTSLDEVKARVARVLIENGRLKPLSAADGAGFLTALTTPLSEYPQALHPAFVMLATFQLSYQGFIHYRLRKHLDCLTPDAGGAKLGAKPSAREVVEVLEDMYGQALNDLRFEFEDWPRELNQVAFAVVEEFVDRVLRSQDAKREW